MPAVAKTRVDLVIHNEVLQQFLSGPRGPVYQDMIRRADILQKAAKLQIARGTGESGPGGHLKDSLKKRIYGNPGGRYSVQVWVGSEHPRALMYHEGTSPHQITSRTPGKPLHFVVEGMEVYAMYVNHPGTSPNRYLTDNLPLVGMM